MKIFRRGKPQRIEFLSIISRKYESYARSVALIRLSHQGLQHKSNSLLLNFQTFCNDDFSLKTDRYALASYYFIKFNIKFFSLKNLRIEQKFCFGGRELTAARSAFSFRNLFNKFEVGIKQNKAALSKVGQNAKQLSGT